MSVRPWQVFDSYWYKCLSLDSLKNSKQYVGLFPRLKHRSTTKAIDQKPKPQSPSIKSPPYNWLWLPSRIQKCKFHSILGPFYDSEIDMVAVISTKLNIYIICVSVCANYANCSHLTPMGKPRLCDLNFISLALDLAFLPFGTVSLWYTRSLGALRAPTSRLRLFGPALGPSGLLDYVLHALRALRPCDPCISAMMG